jgi:hypothetical protein
VDYAKAFPLLSIARPKNLQELDLIKSGQKNLSAGSKSRINYAKYKNITRGTLSSEQNTTFANSITISLKLDISDVTSVPGETKDINLKLSAGKIQMCGAKSRQMAMNAAQQIVNNLLQIEELLNWIAENRDSAEITKLWVLEITKGDLYINVSMGTFLSRVKKLCQDMSPPFPSDVYQPLARYMMDLGWDFDNHELFEKHLNWLLTIRHIIQPLEPRHEILRPIKVNTAMVNFNYPLGFKIRKMALCQIIEKMKPGCRARYNPLYDRHVTIYYPRCSEEDPDKIKYSTLIVYTTGHVTQSGPSPEIGFEIYQAFIELANSIRPRIDLAALEGN